MKTIIINFLIFFCILLSACKKDAPTILDPSPNVPCLDTVPYCYELLWHTPFHPTVGNNISTVPYLVGDVLITSYLDDNASYSYIHGYNSLTGEHLWTWSDYHFGGHILQLRETKEVHGNNLIVANRNDYHAIDLATGQTVWAVECPKHLSHGTTMVRIGDYIYDGGRGKGENQYRAELFRMHLDHPGQFEKVFDVVDTTEVTMSLGLPSLAIDSQGDSILYLIGKGYHQTNPKLDKTAFYAYNLTRQTLLWVREYLDADGSWIPPLIEGERMFVASTEKRIECLDLKTGATLWKKTITRDGFMHSGDIILEQGVLIVVNNFGWILALNHESGQELWNTNTSSYLFVGSPNKIDAHKGIVYIANSSVGCNLSAWNVHTGANYWCENSINADTYYNCSISASGLTIDKKKGLLYTTDGYDILCMKTIR